MQKMMPETNKTTRKLALTQYRDVLIHELQARVQRNPAYSLTSFARDLGLAPSGLSRILSGKQGLSSKKAKQIAKKLDLNETESGYFCSLIEAEHARSKNQRVLAQLKLQSQAVVATELSLEYFKTISDWHYFAILEITNVKGFVNDASWIAHYLGLSIEVVEASIQRLVKLELLKVTPAGMLVKTNDYLATSNDIPSRAIRSYHQQILRKAEAALFEQAVDVREFSAITFPMSQEDMLWAKQEIRNFKENLAKRLVQKETKECLYQFSMQLFCLEQGKTVEENTCA